MKGNEDLKCSIVERNVTLDLISEITKNQRNTKTLNDRDGEEDAFEVALRGSKVYLREHKLLDAGEE